MKKNLLSILTALPLALHAAPTITPGAIWSDDRGQHIQAHGGGVVRFGDAWYWFGEDRSQDIPKGARAVACYASGDLAHWQFRSRVLLLTDAEVGIPDLVVERPKVYYNAKTKKFVMYIHIDDRYHKAARVGVSICDTVDGNYRYLRSFRPLNEESRDIGQFIDDDGSAYLIFESRPTKGFFIAKLSDDYLDVEKQMSFIQMPLEAGSLVRFGVLYYVIGSQMSSWKPNPNKYATAQSLDGPWSEFKDIAPPEKSTYGSQSTFLLEVVGSRKTSVIFMGDQWNPLRLGESRHLWMPLEIGGGDLRLPEPKPWGIDAQTGEVTISDIK